MLASADPGYLLAQEAAIRRSVFRVGQASCKQLAWMKHQTDVKSKTESVGDAPLLSASVCDSEGSVLESHDSRTHFSKETWLILESYPQRFWQARPYNLWKI